MVKSAGAAFRPSAPHQRALSRLGDPCRLNQPRRRLLMSFMLAGEGWRISFLEADCRTSLKRKLVFSEPDKILEMARRGGADLTSAARCDLEHGISIGRGGVWLNLTAEQYRALKEPVRWRAAREPNVGCR